MLSNHHSIAGVLLDVGGTIAYAKNGSWFIPSDYPAAFTEESFEAPSLGVFYDSVAAGAEYLDNRYQAKDLQEELLLFEHFYWQVLRAIYLRDPPEELPRRLAKMKVFQNDNFAFYPDVVPIIAKLRDSGIRVGIVSDNWPSLIIDLERHGRLEWFATVTISSVVGSRKPDRQIYLHALQQMRTTATETLLIDDGIENVKAAVGMGMHGLQMKRNNKRPMGEYEVIRSMDQAIDYISGINSESV